MTVNRRTACSGHAAKASVDAPANRIVRDTNVWTVIAPLPASSARLLDSNRYDGAVGAVLGLVFFDARRRGDAAHQHQPGDRRGGQHGG